MGVNDWRLQHVWKWKVTQVVVMQLRDRILWKQKEESIMYRLSKNLNIIQKIQSFFSVNDENRLN